MVPGFFYFACLNSFRWAPIGKKGEMSLITSCKCAINRQQEKPELQKQFLHQSCFSIRESERFDRCVSKQRTSSEETRSAGSYSDDASIPSCLDEILIFSLAQRNSVSGDDHRLSTANNLAQALPSAIRDASRAIFAHLCGETPRHCGSTVGGIGQLRQSRRDGLTVRDTLATSISRSRQPAHSHR